MKEYYVPPGGIVVVLNPLLICIILVDAVITHEGAEGNVAEKFVQELWEYEVSGIPISAGYVI